MPVVVAVAITESGPYTTPVESWRNVTIWKSYVVEGDRPYTVHAEPNSIVPAASALVTNAAGAILLQLRTDNGFWALPGGTMHLGESIAATAVRDSGGAKQPIELLESIEVWLVVPAIARRHHAVVVDHAARIDELIVCADVCEQLAAVLLEGIERPEGVRHIGDIS